LAYHAKTPIDKNYIRKTGWTKIFSMATTPYTPLRINKVKKRHKMELEDNSRIILSK
jgi:hypothetical protein